MTKLDSLRDLQADLWVFDNDGVVYENTKGAEREVVNRMIQFIASRYGCSVEKASVIRKKLLEKHKVPHSIMALVREGFDEQEVLKETYFAINLNELDISPSIEIQELFSFLSGIKVMLTNNHEEYAKIILDQLGILNYFSAIYGINKLGRIQKPDFQAFQLVQNAMGISKNIVFIDDEIKNVIAATKFGWTTVWIGDMDYEGLQLPKLC